MQKFALIMAGGGGTRFWPLSRQNMPKQLLNLSGNDAMINETIKRSESLISIKDTFIVTNKKQVGLMDDILMDSLPRENIITEPLAKNTAPCILYAALNILEKCGDGILCIFPSDHYITQNEKFVELLEKAIDTADDSNKIVTIGMKPNFPATGYGYIKVDLKSENNGAYIIDKFVEKPTAEKAKEYVEASEYYWNSGMFICKLSVLIELFERFLPKLYCEFQTLKGSFYTNNHSSMVEDIYTKITPISIDYGIMERVNEALVIIGDFGWNDVGSWDALGSVFPTDEAGNIVKADHISNDTKECIIYGGNRLIVTVGLYNTVIVDTNDAVLICDKHKAQDVRYIVDKLKELGRTDLI